MNKSTTEAPRANIELHIERVVLEGLSVQSRDRVAIGRAVEVELRRLLEQGGWAAGAASVALPSLRGEAIQWSAANGINNLGTQIAQAVYRSFAGSVVGGVKI